MLRCLEYDDKHRIYRVRRLNGFAQSNGRGAWYFTSLPGQHTDAWIGVEGSRFDLDGFLDAVLREPIPHARLIRGGSKNGHAYEYRYDPWELNIYVDERRPREGNTFKATFHHYQLKLNRLRNFRAFLKLLQEAKCES